MPLTEQELKKMFKQVRDAEPVPDFERTWRQAETRLLEKSSRFTRWRWCLGPTVLLFASAAAALLIVAVSHQPATAPLQGVAVVEAGVDTQVSQEQAARPEPPAALSDLATPQDRETSLIALGYGTLEEELYEAPTDFLLELEPTTWDEAEKESLL